MKLSLKYQTEKHDHEKILKSLKIDNEYYKKKYKRLNKKKVFVIITEILIESGSAFSTSTMSLINPSVGIVLTSLSAFLTSMAILITFEYIRRLKLRYTKLRDWIIFITIFYEKTLRESMVLKKWIKTKPSNWNRFLITTLINEKKLWIQLKSK